MKWYYAQGDEELGPVNDEALKQMLQTGQLAETSEVWRDGMGDWRPANSLSELIPFLPTSVRQHSSLGGRTISDYVDAFRIKRFAAFWIDNIPVGLLFAATDSFVLDLVLGVTLVGPQEIVAFSILAVIGVAVYYRLLYFLLHGVLLFMRGQSIGKMVMGIKIVDQFADRPANIFKVLFYRYLIMDLCFVAPILWFGALTMLQFFAFVCLFFGITSGFVLICMVMAVPLSIDHIFVLGGRRLALHHRMAGTRVVEVKRPVNRYLGR